VSTVILSIFWVSVAVIAYTYVGYPLLLACLTHRRLPAEQEGSLPTLDVLIAAYNEAGCIVEKLRNSVALDYPTDKLTITVVTDGSTDATPDLVREMAGDSVRLLHQPERRGKGAALARALPHLQGEIVLFTDANCLLAPSTARQMVRHFPDSRVGGVSGAKRVGRRGTESDGESIYWRYESWLKELDSRFGSVMGAPGEIWAARRAAYQAPPPDIVLDDFYASMDLVARGWRVEYEPEALSFEEPSPSLGAEWERRTRNAAGGFQAVFRLKQVWRAGARTVFQYVSHRVLRWIVTPALLALLPVWTLLLLPQPLYLACLLMEGLFALSALAGWALASRGKSTGWFALPLQVALLNASALAGGVRFLRGRTTVLWPKVRD
jgi:cellulose synthase/poly-beta-1,6-N-acetylglucosamine synthase-like glycosyltransferase